MKKLGRLLIIFFVLSTIGNLSFSQPKNYYDIRDFGAKGDGETINTEQINNAIEKAASNGGGTVYFPSGKFRSYTIRLKSNISLYLEQGCILIGPKETDKQGYDDSEPIKEWAKYQDIDIAHGRNRLIWGENISNISIAGPGLIYGEGLATSVNMNTLTKVGAGAVGIKNCRNVIIRDISILHGGHFAVALTGTDNITIDNICIDTNRDGIDIDCCKGVKVSNCTINSPNNDAIAIKSSFALGFPRATENVTINNCLFSGDYEGTILHTDFFPVKKEEKTRVMGRIKMGTECNGGFKNITISNCAFNNTDGIILSAVDGGTLENITLSNISMRKVNDAPILIRLGRRMRGPESLSIGKCRRILINNFMASDIDSLRAVMIMGLPEHKVEDVIISNSIFSYKGGGTKVMAKTPVPGLEEGYPSSTHWHFMPAYGAYIRHARKIQLRGVEFIIQKPDERPKIVTDDVTNFQRVR